MDAHNLRRLIKSDLQRNLWVDPRERRLPAGIITKGNNAVVDAKFFIRRMTIRKCSGYYGNIVAKSFTYQ